MKKQKGFTLIELLVVISIISFLASAALVTLNSSRIKARDARRKADLKTITKALELYFDDNGAYPPSPCGYDCWGYYSSTNSNWDTFQTYLTPYLSKLPKDPLNTGTAPWSGGYSYSYAAVGKTANPPQYDLTGVLESAADPDRCAAKSYHYYFDQRPWCGPYSGQIIEMSPL